MINQALNLISREHFSALFEAQDAERPYLVGVAGITPEESSMRRKLRKPGALSSVPALVAAARCALFWPFVLKAHLEAAKVAQHLENWWRCDGWLPVGALRLFSFWQ